MGLLRTAAIIAIGVSLLPADREKQEQLYQRAAAAANWTLTFCDRNADTCEKAETLWTDFAAKAQFGAQLALDVVRDSDAGNSIGDKPQAARTSYRLEPPAPNEKNGTLRPSDLKPDWRGKSAPGAGI